MFEYVLCCKDKCLVDKNHEIWACRIVKEGQLGGVVGEKFDHQIVHVVLIQHLPRGRKVVVSHLGLCYDCL